MGSDDQGDAQLQGTRLQVYLARCGIGSRRKNEEYIAAGRASVNGKTVTAPGTKVYPGDEVCFDVTPIEPESVHRYIALYKPPPFICSNSDPQNRPLAIDLLKPYYSERLYNVGRLDFMSEGLIFFTNDGNFTRIVSHPSSEIEKEYLVYCHDPVSEKTLRDWMGGVNVEGTFYKIKTFSILHTREVRLTLIEGKNREIRTLFKSQGIDIKRLIRERIGPVTIKGLSPGSHRILSSEEVDVLLRRGTQ